KPLAGPVASPYNHGEPLHTQRARTQSAMPVEAVIAVVIIAGLLALAAWLLPRYVAAGRRAAIESLCRAFPPQREQLEAKFFATAAASGMPRGLDWVECDFEPEVVFAKRADHDELVALVGMSIKFEATPGGDMEEVEAVANRKYATAVFISRDTRWTTEGRAIMNLDPRQAINHFGEQLQLLDRP
ncbi:MAG: hypothetical protein WEA31_05280, partial [Pirellulales bacterium]